jgi:LCP family protein required for cell wall assembly
MSQKSENFKKKSHPIIRRRWRFYLKFLLKKIGKVILWILFVLVILFIGLEVWARIQRSHNNITETKYTASQLLKENASLRKSILDSCISENGVRSYLMLDEKDCATLFPDLLEEISIEYSLEHEFLAFFQAYFLSETSPSPILNTSPQILQEKKIEIMPELNALLEEKNLLQYLADYSFSLEKTDDAKLLLKKGDIIMATIAYDAEKKEVFAEIPEKSGSISISHFSKTLGEGQIKTNMSEEEMAALKDIKGDASPRKNILILGKNDGNVDTIILASIDNVRKKITLISLPRDLWVGARKINSWYGAYGANAFIEELESLFGQKIAHYVLIEMESFPRAIDIIGGISYTFDAPLIDPSYKTIDNGEEGTLYFSSGTFHLSGIQALRVARSRFTTSDFSRSARQQNILLAIQKRVVSLYGDNNGAIIKIISLVLKNVKTDMTPAEIFSIYLSAKDYPVQSGNVMSSGNILTSQMLDIGNGRRTYVLLPNNEDWDLLKKFVWSALLR